MRMYNLRFCVVMNGGVNVVGGQNEKIALCISTYDDSGVG